MNALLHYLCVFTLVLCFSCEDGSLCPVVAIPETDVIAPTYTLSINGPGFGQTLSVNDGWRGGLITLKTGGNYSFVLSASDAGGVRLVQMQMPVNGVLTVTQINPERASRRSIGVFSEMLELTNNEEAPTRCLILSGRFTTPSDPSISATIGMAAMDYGGASRATNRTIRDLAIGFTDDILNIGFEDF